MLWKPMGTCFFVITIIDWMFSPAFMGEAAVLNELQFCRWVLHNEFSLTPHNFPILARPSLLPFLSLSFSFVKQFYSILNFSEMQLLCNLREDCTLWNLMRVTDNNTAYGLGVFIITNITSRTSLHLLLAYSWRFHTEVKEPDDCTRSHSIVVPKNLHAEICILFKKYFPLLQLRHYIYFFPLKLCV